MAKKQQIELRTTKQVPPAQVRQLFRLGGWPEDIPRFPDGKVRAMLRRSYLVVSAWYGKTLVGLVSVVSDGSISAYIENLMVAPAYRRRGIAKAMLRRALAELRKQKVPFIFTLGPRAASAGKGLFAQTGFRALKWIPYVYPPRR